MNGILQGSLQNTLLTATEEMALIKSIQRGNTGFGFSFGRKEGQHYLKDLMSCLVLCATKVSALYRARNQAKHYETGQRPRNAPHRHLLTTGAPSLFRLADSQGLPHKDIKTCFEEATALRERFVKANLRLVANVAQRFDNRRLGFLDKIQEGSHGLLIGLQGFDPEKGFRFSTYAHWWIRQSVERGIQNLGATIRIPVHVHDHVRSFRKARASLVTQLGREPTHITKRTGLELQKSKTAQ